MHQRLLCSESLLLALFLAPLVRCFCPSTSSPFLAFLTPTRQTHAHPVIATVAPIQGLIPNSSQRRPLLFGLRAKLPGGDEEEFDDIDLEADDVPADWTEADIAAELGDIVGDLNAGDADEEIIADDFVAAEVEPLDDENEAPEYDDDDVADEDDLDDIVLELEDEDDELDDTAIGVEGFVESDYDSDTEYDPSMDASDEWDEDDEDTDELLDDPDDPNYMKQKELVLADIAASLKRAQAEEFDAEDWLMNQMTDEQAKELDNLPFFRQVEEAASEMQFLTEDDVKDIDIESEITGDYDMVLDEPYPRSEKGEPDMLQEISGVTDEDMEKLDKAFKEVNEIVSQEPWDQVMTTANKFDWSSLDNQTATEIQEVLLAIKGSSYNVTNWLLYDLNFNVSNLMLAAIKHNPNAPILFQHWYPQLTICERYKQARDNNFDFTWEDVQAADITELERYYRGFGYNEIPNKAPAETGIISFEDLDEEEIKMAAFENWMKEVYNPEWDKKDFDDDAITDEDNVFSDYYVHPQHPDIPDIDDVIDDYDEWQYNMRKSNDGEEWENHEMIAQRTDYTYVKDEEFEREFRGHLVIACSGAEEDLNTAEKITERFGKEFGKKVFVETRLMALAREEDNVFEIWLESYEIDLLHSKKRATGLSDDWTGPAECDDKQIDWLVERVRFLISDDARYSYRMELERIDQ